MSFVGKWYGFGHSSSYDAGIRAREKGETAVAVSFFREALTEPLEPSLKKVIARTLANALGRLAKELLESKTEESQRLLEEGLKLEPGFADLWLWKARTSRLLGLANEESEGVDRALAINPRYAEALLHRAALKARSQDWPQAQADLAAALEAMPRLAGAESQEAAACLAEQNPAAEASLLSLRAQPPKVLSLIDEGDLLGMKRQWVQAEATFSEAIQLAPHYADLRSRRAQALMELDRLAEADEELQAALDLNPRYAEALAVRGILRKRQGDSEGAASFFRQALDADPSQPIAREELRRGLR